MEAWDRIHYEGGGGNALVLFAIYGVFGEAGPISGSKYRTKGIPEGVDLRKLSAQKDGPLPFTDSEFLDVVEDADGALASTIRNAPECMILKGEVSDPPDLEYLRSSVGLIAYFLDHGGVAVADPQQLKFFDAQTWRETFFQTDEPFVFRHVMIYYSDEEVGGGRWYHTRGLRKFGRPDLSLRNVPGDYHEAARELCNRFIEMQALGALIPEGQEIRMKTLPEGLTCHHRGDFDDPDFNNVHIEIEFSHG